MKILGPERYALKFDSKVCAVVCPRGLAKFSGIASTSIPKLYVILAGGNLLYVGITRQRMSARLRLGFNASGESGYHGYAWRHKFTEASLIIWGHDDAPPTEPSRDIETVEAEVVFLMRKSTGQWPAGQTEIHFHASTEVHREIAGTIWKTINESSENPKSK